MKTIIFKKKKKTERNEKGEQWGKDGYFLIYASLFLPHSWAVRIIFISS